MEKKTYIFLCDEIYSPEEQTGTMGEIVEVTEVNGVEIYFTVLSTGKKGFVVYPQLFAENTPRNRTKMAIYKQEIYEAKWALKKANATLDSFDRVNFQ